MIILRLSVTGPSLPAARAMARVPPVGVEARAVLNELIGEVQSPLPAGADVSRWITTLESVEATRWERRRLRSVASARVPCPAVMWFRQYSPETDMMLVVSGAYSSPEHGSVTQKG